MSDGGAQKAAINLTTKKHLRFYCKYFNVVLFISAVLNEIMKSWRRKENRTRLFSPIEVLNERCDVRPFHDDFLNNKTPFQLLRYYLTNHTYSLVFFKGNEWHCLDQATEVAGKAMMKVVKKSSLTHHHHPVGHALWDKRTSPPSDWWVWRKELPEMSPGNVVSVCNTLAVEQQYNMTTRLLCLCVYCKKTLQIHNQGLTTVLARI